MAEVYLWDEAVKDYKKLDGSLQQWVDTAIRRLEQRGSEIGKRLSNNSYSELAGFKELKNQKMGIRLIFRSQQDGTIEIIEIAAIGKRESERVFKEVGKRRKKRRGES